jgi:hypothetical protein
MADTAFWIDRESDSAAADRAGGSRFFNYIRNNENWFADCWDSDDPKADFAATAWQIANGPVMSPGYVSWDPKILRAEFERSDWDGKLLACVDVITPAPQALRTPTEWGGGVWWRGWPSESMITRESYYEPGGRELCDGPYILPSVSLRWAVPDVRVPAAPASRPAMNGLQRAARQCVEILVAELNSTINPVLAQLGR